MVVFNGGILSSLFLLFLVANSASGDGVRLRVLKKYVIMDNGIVQVTLSKPDGMVTGIRYNGIKNLLETYNSEDKRGYWDLNWSAPGGPGLFDIIQGTDFNIILQNKDQVELSFRRTWNPSQNGSIVPLNIDKRFILLKDSHGFYTYSIYEHLQGWPDFNLAATRLTFKLRKDMFRYMAVDKLRQRLMPLPDDRMSMRSQILAYPEAVRLVNPVDSDLIGEVDDKYQYSSENKDIKVHGWVGNNAGVGFWHITPSQEYRSGGPFKQELTSHVGPTTLTVFLSPHYMGSDETPWFVNGEAWKKVFGPVFIYLNSGPPKTNGKTMWNDAYSQALVETKNWPYNFPVSEDFPKSIQRGSVYGRLLVQDRYINKRNIRARFAHVGLALPGDVGSWQTETKGYQFWVTSDKNGSFAINNIRPGVYNLYASVPGLIGDYKYEKVVTINPGDNIDLGSLIYSPPRNGPTLWEIGYPDRSAAEFFVPDPDPNYVNKLYLKHDKFRQYGLWEKYSILYPTEDLVYTVNVSNHRKDWFYAHVNRKNENAFYPTTWKIKFNLTSIITNSSYTLRLALASATYAELQVRFNVLNADPPHFTTGLIGKDNAVARHGVHGLYRLYNIDVNSNWLVQGENTIFLTQKRAAGPFRSVMYDYLRLEGSSIVSPENNK